MNPSSRRRALALLVWGAALGLAYGQSPLYTSNQNQYFLHGLAQAGAGQLAADWLANTRDPTPLFTVLVRLMATVAGTVGAQATLTQPAISLNAFALLNYLLYLLLFGLYLASAFGIAHRLYRLGRSPTRTLLFFGLLFVAHSAALRYALTRLSGGEWAYLFDGGLGGQRLLGPVFQPSVFGVLLLCSIWLHSEKRPLLAMLAAALAAAFHPTYLLSAGVLSAVYWIGLVRGADGSRRPALAAVVTLVLTLPILAYVSSNFLPPSEAALQILVEFRIPNHAVPAEWFGLPAAFKLAWVAAALVLARGTRLLAPTLALSGMGAALTIGQLLTGSHSLALLFPWRASATLVPLASAVLVGKLVHALSLANPPPGQEIPGSTLGRAPGVERTAARQLRPSAVRGIALGLVVLSLVSGLSWSALQLGQRRSMPERELFEYVERTLAPGQLYLVPSKMQDFRLATGAPILADFKSHPYYGPEVLEWHARLRLLDYFYRGSPEAVDCGLLEVFAGEYGVTHVVLEPDQRGLQCARLDQLYDDGAYSVHAIADEQR